MKDCVKIKTFMEENEEFVALKLKLKGLGLIDRRLWIENVSTSDYTISIIDDLTIMIL